MATDEELGLPIKGTYPAKVIEVIDEFKVIINRGELNRMRINDSHLVYSITNKPIYDPITRDFIGHRILYKGSGMIVSVEEIPLLFKLAIILGTTARNLSMFVLVI